MWSYYGSKSKIVKHYPKPIYNKIIEPFAGSARYSLLYWEHDILLVDKYEVIVNIWKWLQKCSKQDILSLPKLKAGDRITEQHYDCVEQFELLRFLYQQGSVAGNKVYWWGEKSFERQIKNISENLFKIKHWEIRQADYRDIPNEQATWFIDSPYSKAGYRYKFNSKMLDYADLAKYSKERLGQVIVCEAMGAEWMDFKPLVSIKGINNTKSVEAIWTNQKEQSLFTLI